MNLIGKKYNRLLVIKFVGKDRSKKHNKLLCKCDCGNEEVVYENDLKRGHTKSCGCYRREVVRNRSLVHGFYIKKKQDKFYKMWSQMKQRCGNKNNPDFKHYGGRGIIYDLRWDDFLEFKKDMYFKYLYAKKHLKIKNPSLERVDVNGNYNKENCTFIERKHQPINQRRIRMFKAISPSGEIFITKNVSGFSRKHKLSRSKISMCLNNKINRYKGWIFKYL